MKDLGSNQFPVALFQTQVVINRNIGLTNLSSSERKKLRQANSLIFEYFKSEAKSVIAQGELKVKLDNLLAKTGIKIPNFKTFTNIAFPKKVNLSRREMELLRRLPKGNSIRELAEIFNLTEATIKSHLVSIYRKFEVKNRVQAIARAKEQGLLEL